MADGFDSQTLRDAAQHGRIHWHQHALERFLERDITRGEVINAIVDGEIIETYPTDRPHPSCLILHVSSLPLHVVVAENNNDGICLVITAYRPSLEYFESDYRTRRKSHDQ